MSGVEPYRREVSEKVESGWRIEEETADRVTLVRRTVGSPTAHLVIAVITIWWAMGVPNLLYGAYKYSDAERTVVWKESTTRGATPGASTADTGPTGE